MNENHKPPIMPPIPVLSIADQVRLIGAILDQVCGDFIESYPTPVGTWDVRCRYCKAIGISLMAGQMSIPHADACAIALNAQLQESLKPVEQPKILRFFGE